MRLTGFAFSKQSKQEESGTTPFGANRCKQTGCGGQEEVHMDIGDRGQRTAERAYMLWEQEGRPEGRDMEHWLKAEAELASVLAPSRKRELRTGTRRSRRKAS
jgi:Protein of unknown function (DUF2934)